jgi:uncharacterized Zn-binding protein involved in type VI secretion
MARQGRVGDQAQSSSDEPCAVCGDKAHGPAQDGSPHVFVNGQQALRVGDAGKHQGCSNEWKALKGSTGVYIDGKPAFRFGDESSHCKGKGELVEASPDVFIGDYGGGTSKPVLHDKSVSVSLKDGLGRPVHDAVAVVSCPHTNHDPKPFDGQTTVSGLCTSATVTVHKSLQKGKFDAGASHPAPGLSHSSVGDAAAAEHVVHAPAPSATPHEDNQIAIVRPKTDSVAITMSTVHNWVDLVYQAFGFSIPTGATELALLGVREASLAGKGDLDALEADAGAGKTDKVAFTSEARAASLAKAPTTWNDLLFCVYTDSDVKKTQRVEVFECTIDAGEAESPIGLPITLEGKLYGGYPGDHISSRYPGNDICLHLFSGARGKMELAREWSKTSRSFNAIEQAKTPSTHWKFADDEDNASIHMHFGLELGQVGNWSTGCTVLHHHYFVTGKDGKKHPDPKATRYKRFMELFNGAANKKNIPYLVVSSKYVKLYPDWVRARDAAPGEPATPKTVIWKDRLEHPEGMTGLVPSFMTKAFADAVLALAKETKDAKKAANLRSSLERCLLDVKL